ncbi:hypothetical protein [Actinomadura sp. BRA 177]|uniref:hypothetical protein n=1 Tax=Actinomadura sp. BRA 177 TaxID=2745202 RepID=UPI0015951A43|nr:hypothetical protein [Actinomadura sp. BRA 177]NVI89946.1 hypothetical protein [Actinomadura sp. BRA 177]
MTGPYLGGPVELYAWDVRFSDGGRGGVTDDRVKAIRDIHDALREVKGGVRGVVRRVGLSPVGFAKYVELGHVGEAWRDEKTGAVMWRDV